MQRSPRHEVARVIEGGEERDAEPAVGERVEKSVGSGDEEEECDKRPPSPTEAPRMIAVDPPHDDEAQQRGEGKRVGHASMTPRVAIVHAIGMKGDIQIGQGRADHRYGKERPRHLPRERRLAEGYRNERMCEYSRDMCYPSLTKQLSRVRYEPLRAAESYAAAEEEGEGGGPATAIAVENSTIYPWQGGDS